MGVQDYDKVVFEGQIWLSGSLNLEGVGSLWVHELFPTGQPDLLSIRSNPSRISRMILMWLQNFLWLKNFVAYLVKESGLSAPFYCCKIRFSWCDVEIKRSELGTRENSTCLSLPNCKALESNCRGQNNGSVCRAWGGTTWGTTLKNHLKFNTLAFYFWLCSFLGSFHEPIMHKLILYTQKKKHSYLLCKETVVFLICNAVLNCLKNKNVSLKGKRLAKQFCFLQSLGCH